MDESSDLEARKARAASLRRQIDSLGAGKTPSQPTDPEPESPRDFVHRRMKEEEEGKGSGEERDPKHPSL